MRILMLVNWKVRKCTEVPENIQPPDYCVYNEDYWFYRYFKEKHQVDVVDISSNRWIERFEKDTLRFYIWQTLRCLPFMHRYDLIVSHGMQSGIVISLWRRLFHTKAKHIVFDIGAFNSAAESGMALKLMQFASKSIDGIIYHTSSQSQYYEKFFPWLTKRSVFIRFGTDLEYFNSESRKFNSQEKYILCIGYNKRDWKTLIGAYRRLHTEVELRLVGHVDKEYKDIPGIKQIPYISVDELKEQIAGSLFGVLPLQFFNYSFGQMTLMQQMAMQKCVIVADVPSVKDYVQDGKTAILYRDEDAMDLSKKIMYALQNPHVCEKIGHNAKSFLDNECNEKIMAGEIELYINKCVRFDD